MEEEFSMEGSMSVYPLKMMTIQETQLLGRVDPASRSATWSMEQNVREATHTRGWLGLHRLSLPPSGV